MIELYTDGACRGNGKPENIGAYACILIFEGKEKMFAYSVKNTTNNIMELTAVIEGLKEIKNKSLPVTVYTDSQYVVATINDGWKIRKNQELWKEYFEIAKEFKSLTIKWTKGHNGHGRNEQADMLCNRAMDLGATI